ncbi:MAG TPA: RNA polymerase sigma-70 factor [Gemmatimonadaceae bacterium]|jgi:RNA polymerase sigma-19 factor, ECF subfamily|nr:RNA polymerase sigma-70 factor [Gemmatimonadaceae bacterium]
MPARVHHPRHVASETTDLDQRFDALVRREYPRLAELAYVMLRHRADAEDVVQEVLLGVWRHRERFDFDDPVPYLVRAVRNRALSSRRRRGTEWRWLGLHPRQTPEAPPAIRLEHDELLRDFYAAMRALPERRREIFVLHRVNGLSYAQIASVLGISVKTVENQMGRALDRLRKALRSHLGVTIVVAISGRLLSLIR